MMDSELNEFDEYNPDSLEHEDEQSRLSPEERLQERLPFLRALRRKVEALQHQRIESNQPYRPVGFYERYYDWKESQDADLEPPPPVDDPDDPEAHGVIQPDSIGKQKSAA